MTNDKTVTMSRGLEPCPFCGDSPKVIRTSGDERDGYADHVSYVCKGCGCSRGAVGDSSKGGYADNKTVEQRALSAWNTRDVPVVERQEPVAWTWSGALNDLREGASCTTVYRNEGPGVPIALYTSPPAPVSVPEKYDDVLLPFLALMRAELHANAHKGDRPGWLQMDSKTAILEVFYHMGKLHQAVHRGEEAAIKEYAADVANMCMMLLDVRACLDKVKEMDQPPRKMCDCNQGRLPCTCK